MSAPPTVFGVGDEVVWSSVNARASKRYHVTKVGRTRVYIDGDSKPYRIATGARDDGFGHEHITPLPVAEWYERRDAAYRYFAEHGLQSSYRCVDHDWVIWARDVLVAAEGAKP